MTIYYNTTLDEKAEEWEVWLPFKGTKKWLFDKAVELFAERSFESVTIKDIVDEVGVAPSTFYNHFKSKQEVMDTIYDFFLHRFLSGFDGNFHPEYEKLLVATMQILLQRTFVDARARELVEKSRAMAGQRILYEMITRRRNANYKPSGD